MCPFFWCFDDFTGTRTPGLVLTTLQNFFSRTKETFRGFAKIRASSSERCQLRHVVACQLVQGYDTVAEWLRRLTRNQLGLSRAGSSPVSVAEGILLYVELLHTLHF